MIILICGLAVVMAGASALTTYAVLTAKDGYEDEFGFHAVPMTSDIAGQTKKKVDGDLPPFAPAR